MASGVEELLDMLFEMVDEAKNVAFSNDKCIIERDQALDLIDDIREELMLPGKRNKKEVAAWLQQASGPSKDS